MWKVVEDNVGGSSMLYKEVVRRDNGKRKAKERTTMT
jgi:hypothetical protein